MAVAVCRSLRIVVGVERQSTTKEPYVVVVVGVVVGGGGPKALEEGLGGPERLEGGLLEPMLGLGLAGTCLMPFGTPRNHFWASGWRGAVWCHSEPPEPLLGLEQAGASVVPGGMMAHGVSSRPPSVRGRRACCGSWPWAFWR